MLLRLVFDDGIKDGDEVSEAFAGAGAGGHDKGLSSQADVYCVPLVLEESQVRPEELGGLWR